MGEVGWTPDQVRAATFPEAVVAVKYHRALERSRDKLAWERARMVATYTVAPWSKGIKKFTDLFRFPWERPKGEKVKKTTTGEALTIALQWEKEMQDGKT